MPKGIRTVESDKDSEGNYLRVRLVFGPHYFVELQRGRGDTVNFQLGYTHHGFKADASEVGGELEEFIGEIRDAHPDNRGGLTGASQRTAAAAGCFRWISRTVLNRDFEVVKESAGYPKICVISESQSWQHDFPPI